MENVIDKKPHYTLTRKGSDGRNPMERIKDTIEFALNENNYFTRDDLINYLGCTEKEIQYITREIKKRNVFEEKRVYLIDKNEKITTTVYKHVDCNADYEKFVFGKFGSEEEQQIKRNRIKEVRERKMLSVDFGINIEEEFEPDLIIKKLASIRISKEQYEEYYKLRKANFSRKKICEKMNVDRLFLINGIINYEKQMNIRKWNF